MFILGAVVFWLPPARTALIWINDAVVAALAAGSAGARFLFGPLALNPGESTAAGEPSVGFILAAQALPAVAAGDVDEAMRQVIVNCSVVVIVFAVVPWRYVWQRYVAAKGDRWRGAAA